MALIKFPYACDVCRLARAEENSEGWWLTVTDVSWSVTPWSDDLAKVADKINHVCGVACVTRQFEKYMGVKSKIKGA